MVDIGEIHRGNAEFLGELSQALVALLPLQHRYYVLMTQFLFGHGGNCKRLAAYESRILFTAQSVTWKDFHRQTLPDVSARGER
jgi:hypothetical protein